MATNPDKVLFISRAGGLLEPGRAEAAAASLPLPARGVIPALLRFAASGYGLVVIDDRPRGAGDEDARSAEEATLRALFESQGIALGDFLVCTHGAGGACDCSKPGLGLVRDYIAGNRLDRAASAAVGAGEAELGFASNIGVRGFRTDAEGASTWADIAHALLDKPRAASVERKTKETDIAIAVDLDEQAEPHARTGIAFFDHMLEQLGKHGGFALDVECRGDLDVDEHHTIEDVALALGAAIKEALGDKRGIGRYGFLLPMDETEAKVSIDLGGRPYLVFEGDFPREAVGGMPTELVPHFFRSFSDTLGATLHIAVRGENAHHMIEACFKGLARSLRQAIRREGDEVPSTKGTL